MKKYTHTETVEAQQIKWVQGDVCSVKKLPKGETVPDPKDQIEIPAHIVNNHYIDVDYWLVYRGGRLDEVMDPASFEAHFNS